MCQYNKKGNNVTKPMCIVDLQIKWNFHGKKEL